MSQTTKPRPEKLEEAQRAYLEIKRKYGDFFKKTVVEDTNIEPPWSVNGYGRHTEDAAKQKAIKARAID